MSEYWSWLEGSFVWNIRAQQWYNDDPPRHLNGFVDDKSNRFIGWATIRQQRRRLTGCSQQKTNEYCEEKRSFQPGWINETTYLLNSSIDQAFKYRADEELDTYSYVGNHGSYDGGGYVYDMRGRLIDLRSNLSKLHQLGWIDNRTKVVIIQLNLYNPNSQLFTFVTLLAEYLLTGGIETQTRFQPFNFNLAFTTPFQLICSIIYIIFILYFMFVQIQSFFRFKFACLKHFWFYVDLGIIACSWTSVAIYMWRYREAKRIGNLFEETNGYAYINLQLAVYVNDVLTCLLGFCCFFASIQFIRLCRFNPRLSLFTQTLKNVSKELLSFTMMFSIVFMAFIALFYLLFASTMWHCSSVFQTAEMLFEMILMKFDATELIDASAFLGPFSFTLFIFIVVFVCMSMFLTIINDSFRHARENGNDHGEIFSFMWDRFQRWTGLKTIK